MLVPIVACVNSHAYPDHVYVRPFCTDVWPILGLAGSEIGIINYLNGSSCNASETVAADGAAEQEFDEACHDVGNAAAGGVKFAV